MRLRLAFKRRYTVLSCVMSKSTLGPRNPGSLRSFWWENFKFSRKSDPVILRLKDLTMISSCAFVRFWLLIGITLVYIPVTVDAANGENNKKQYDYEKSSENPFFEVCINQ